VKSHANRLRLDGVVWAPGAPLDADTIQAARELVEQARAARAPRKVSPGQRETLSGSAGAPPPSQLAQWVASRNADEAADKVGNYSARNGTEMCVIGGDDHVPFHDRKVEDLFLDFIRRVKPDCVIKPGDLVDFYSISKFPKDLRARIHPTELEAIMARPTDPTTGDIILDTALVREFRLGNELLRMTAEAAGDARKIFVAGNHENRLAKFLKWKAPELLGMKSTDVRGALKLDGLGWEFVYSGNDASWTDWHGVKVGHFNKVNKHSGYTAKLLCEEKRCRIVQGHTHRGGLHFVNSLDDGTTHFGMESFCLCHVAPDYTTEPNWQQGWAVLHWDGETVTPQQIPLLGGAHYWGGERRGAA